jgi:hypothetical protein
MNEQIKKRLEQLAKRNCWSDNEDFSSCDYSGGNFDDAYNGGLKDGEVLLAREILEMLNKENQNG